ncbi:hypothetical protein BSKO_04848 [Bryopsis sp. KO-2023]|nr:hypothetical protein BSKO_04848 [Bryopsis sp. KO-2023]
MGSVQTSAVFLTRFTVLSVLIIWTLCCCSQGTLSYAAPTGAAADDDARQGDAEVVGSWARVDHSTRKLLQEEEDESSGNRKLDVGVLAVMFWGLVQKFRWIAECLKCDTLNEALFNATLEGNSEKIEVFL